MRLARAAAALYGRWLRRQEIGLIEPGTTAGAWVGATVTLYALIGGGVALGQVPKESLPLAFACPVPAIALGFGAAALRRSGRLTDSAFLGCSVVGTGLLVFALAVMTLIATAPLGWVFAATVIVTASLHSWTMKSTADAPMTGIAVFGGVAAALAVAPRGPGLAVFALTSALSLYLSLQIGSWSARAYAERVRLDAYRDAVQAQFLAEQRGRIGDLQASVTELLSLRHDQRNVLFSLSMNVGNLSDEVESAIGKSILVDMHDALAHLTDLHAVQSGAPSGQQGPPSGLEPASISEVASTVARVVGVRYGDIRVDLELSPGDPLVQVRGGAPALHRILLNLMLNACEGDGGPRRATKISVRTIRHPGGDVMTIEVADDGPGLAASVIDRRAAFVTTKRGGTGLGLITVQGLVSASGGRVSLRNGERGGAIVTIELAAAVQ